MNKTLNHLAILAFAAASSLSAIAHTDGERHQKNIVPIPLVHASLHGDIAEVNRLIAAGADVHAATDDGWTALYYAASRGNAKVVKLLIAAGASVNASGWRSPLHLAAVNGHAEIVKLLITLGANFNAKDNQGWASLRPAILFENTEIVKLLIKAGANVNAAGKDDETALYYAAITGHAEIAKVLITAGANVHAEAKYGVTSLHWAALKPQSPKSTNKPPYTSRPFLRRQESILYRAATPPKRRRRWRHMFKIDSCLRRNGPRVNGGFVGIFWRLLPYACRRWRLPL